MQPDHFSLISRTAIYTGLLCFSMHLYSYPNVIDWRKPITREVLEQCKFVADYTKNRSEDIFYRSSVQAHLSQTYEYMDTTKDQLEKKMEAMPGEIGRALDDMAPTKDIVQQEPCQKLELGTTCTLQEKLALLAALAIGTARATNTTDEKLATVDFEAQLGTLATTAAVTLGRWISIFG
jgi:hypothetical protein